MDGRRAILKLGIVAAGNALLAPFRALLGATPAQATRLSPSEEQVIRTFLEEGWNKGNESVIASHPVIAGDCARQFERYRTAFPDLRFNIVSIQKVGDEVQARWTAQGTNRGTLDGRAPTGRRANIQGMTKYKLADGKIVSASPEFDQGALEKQLGGKASG